MKTFCRVTLFLIIMTAPGLADHPPYVGNVYGIYPEGVMVAGSQGSYLIPHTHASFEMNGVRVNYSQLQLNSPVRVFLPDPYIPRVQLIGDPYAWHYKYHPNHPHGGPPGQLKKQHGHKNKHKGKGKGKKH